MGNVVYLSSLENSKRSKAISQKQKQKNLLSQAFAELHRETGIDHRKVLTGDTKELQRLKMRQYQETLKEG